MLLAENATVLAVFCLCLAVFTLGYVLRRWMDEGRAQFADVIAYRQMQARNREGVRHGER